MAIVPVFPLSIGCTFMGLSFLALFLWLISTLYLLGAVTWAIKIWLPNGNSH